MATASHSVTETPTALAGLADGTEYTLQNVGGSTVQVAEAASAPDADDFALVLDPKERIFVTPEAGSSVWVWCVAGASVVVTTEAE